jgi:hypothetical protein
MTPVTRSTPTADPAEAGRPWALVFAVVGGQAAWAVALLVAYPTVQVACRLNLPLLVHLVRWTALAVAVPATLVGYRSWRRLGEAERAVADSPPHATQRTSFVAFGGMLLSGMAVLLLFIEDLATWVIHPCL